MLPQAEHFLAMLGAYLGRFHGTVALGAVSAPISLSTTQIRRFVALGRWEDDDLASPTCRLPSDSVALRLTIAREIQHFREASYRHSQPRRDARKPTFMALLQSYEDCLCRRVRSRCLEG